MIDENSTLEDICFEVSSALHATSIDAVLTGGSAATIYAPSVYTSLDADFVVRRAPRNAELPVVLAVLGYRKSRIGGMFEHSNSKYTIDFLRGPLAVGGDYVKETTTLERGPQRLSILTPTDSVKDRLAHFFHWDDHTALEAAVGIAQSSHGSDVNYEDIARWTARESATGKDFRPKLEQFFGRAGIDRTAL